MQKRLLVWLVPILFGWQVVDSTQIPFELLAQEEYELTQTIHDKYFKTIPQNPNVYTIQDTYSDVELTQIKGQLQPNQSFSIREVLVNSSKQLVFKLSTGEYILADTTILFDDVILNEMITEEYYWLNKDFTVLSSPISNVSKKLDSDLQPYKSVLVSKITTTPKGKFAYISDKGWISMDDLSETDNRMELVQQLLSSKYDKENIAIYVKQLSTGNIAEINQEKQFYSASIAKLPILYYVQEQINSGKENLTTKVRYTSESMNFPGAYLVSGSGSLSKTPDNKEYLLKELIDRTAKESDNVASNLLSYYIANQFNDDFYNTITAITGSKWDMITRETSVQVAGRMMEALYKQNGYVLESLSSTQFDNQRISKDITVPVAHKIGDADDVKHDVAVVYADSPFVLSIFTDKSSYDEISQIANDIYGILK
ncbi:class A beta-lactamase-related serine hydrolase [Streptococcus suis]|nr:class A beta-lactamase-related serine hydrolase [Streptococcus suis]